MLLLKKCLGLELMNRGMVLLFFLCSWFSIAAQEYVPIKNKQEFVSKAKEIAQNTKTIDSDFIQEKYIDIMEDKMISKGHFNFKKQNLIRWEYSSPFNYLIIINDGKIFIKDDNNENKIDMKSNQSFKQINNMIIKSVQGDIEEDDNFKVEFLEDNQEYLVKMTPKTNEIKEFMNQINIYFNKTNYEVDKVKMIENSGDYTAIRFENRKLNVNLPDEKFAFH